MVMDLRGRVCMYCKRVWKMTFLGLKQGQDLDSLRSKRFRLVSEQRKTEERDSRFWPREK